MSLSLTRTSLHAASSQNEGSRPHIPAHQDAIPCQPPARRSIQNIKQLSKLTYQDEIQSQGREKGPGPEYSIAVQGIKDLAKANYLQVMARQLAASIATEDPKSSSTESSSKEGDTKQSASTSPSTLPIASTPCSAAPIISGLFDGKKDMLKLWYNSQRRWLVQPMLDLFDRYETHALQLAQNVQIRQDPVPPIDKHLVKLCNLCLKDVKPLAWPRNSLLVVVS
jgi:hypothetical protein